MIGYVEGIEDPMERLPVAKLELFEQQNKVVLDYNLKYKNKYPWIHTDVRVQCQMEGKRNFSMWKPDQC